MIQRDGVPGCATLCFRAAALGTLVMALAGCGAGSERTSQVVPAVSNADLLRLFLGQHVVGHSCAEPQEVPTGQAVCESLELADLRSNNAVYGYGPADLISAYRVPTARSNGVLVAITIAYGYKSVESDLAQYRSHFNLPPCKSSNGCLKIVGQTGGAPPAELKVPKTYSLQWQMEGQLDLDMVSAICPKCHLLLVEANSSEQFKSLAYSRVHGESPRGACHQQFLGRGSRGNGVKCAFLSTRQYLCRRRGRLGRWA